MSKKKKILIAVITAVVLVAAGLTIFFITRPSGIALADYNQILVKNSDVEVTDEEVDDSIQATLEEEAFTETLSEGTVESGDVITYTYVGILEGEKTPFDGGSAENAVLSVGSGTMIDGFEDGIIGHEIGEPFEVKLTFPEEYDESVAGKNVSFAIEVHSIDRYIVPELNEEFVKNYVEKYQMDSSIVTPEDFISHTKEAHYKGKLHDAMFNYILENSTVYSYDNNIFKKAKAYTEETLASYKASTGKDVITIENYDSEEAYIKDTSEKYTKQIMAIEALFQKLNLSVDKAELDASIEKYITAYGMEYTLDEYKELAGENWLWIYEELGYKFDKIMTALEANVQFVD